MARLSHKVLRMFVLLLLTVFITETVYASSMMAITPNTSNEAEAQVEHCHEMYQSPVQSDNKQESHAQCRDCNHCFACVSMLVQAPFAMLIIQAPPITSLAYLEFYHSPSSTQPQKPPIA